MSAGWESVLAACVKLVGKPGVERVPRAQALGRVLSQTVAADRDYPAGDLSMMDGYAVADLAGSRRVEGENRPGNGPGEALAAGTARRIFTGAEIPRGATRVIPQELIRREGDEIHLNEAPESTFVRPRGAEALRGETVLAPGLRLGAVELALLASFGITEVEVFTRPRVAHLVTGDEVMAHDEKGGPGARIRDSNSDLIAATLRNIGQGVGEHCRVADDRAAACRIVAEMAGRADVLLISGGAGAGDHDHARAALESAGFRFEAQGLDVRPGKPVGLARRGSQWAVALPGNPVSHLVALHLFVLPLLLALEGAPSPGPRLLPGLLEKTPAGSVPRRDTFWPSVARWDGLAWRIAPCRFLSSGDLPGVAGADTLLVLRAGADLPPPGGPVFFLSLTPEFSNAVPA